MFKKIIGTGGDGRFAKELRKNKKQLQIYIQK